MSSPDKAAFEKQLTLTLKTTTYNVFTRKRAWKFNIVPNKVNRLCNCASELQLVITFSID